MTYKLMRCLIILLLVALTGETLFAQGITPAWTRRLTPTHWAEIARLSSIQVIKKKLYFAPLERNLSAALRIKTTPDNLIKHKVFYSGLFARQEKEILLKPVYAKATLGKLTYIHDKHALYFEKMSVRDAQHINQTAFTNHQEILRDLLGTLQTHYQETEPENFTSEIFSKEEILHLNQSPAQPSAYMLSVKQLRDFASLPSLQEQKIWVQQNIAREEEISTSLLLQDVASLSAAQFEQYYRAQTRFCYLKLLANLLERSNQKRPSAIMRYKRPIPGQTTPFTDAQRGGYLQLMQDTHQPIPQSMEEFNTVYGPYAAAEALGAPYEVALQYGMMAPELLGKEEGTRLRQLDPQSCLEELTPKIQALEKKLAALRENPSDTAQFYKNYYQLHAEKYIYQTLVARAKVMQNWSHE